ncbi:winged helix-turn-helix domain-containing protein [Halovivax sp.]|uniref:helix-turn-helix transcriptional regulator n=1 Tax=Halovivax sp. TaxID=1935978 RepID=UPI0025C1E815|nr:transcriptional regulator [Halovivax sp.]
MDPPLAEVAFLVRSDHRVAVLEELADRPADRNDLRAATGASSPTMGRILADFEERRWIVRNGPTYELTAPGEFVADRLREFRDAVRIERTLRDVAQWLPHEIDGFGLELFTDAVVSRPGPGYPYQPVERFAQLLHETERMRGFGMAILKSSNLEAFFERALEDLDCEYVYPPAVFEAVRSWDERTVTEAAARADYTVLLHDDLPLSEWCGVCILDERVSICCYDPETGLLRALVDTESAEMRAWAASLFDRYRAEARPIDAADLTASSEPVS